jgi:hypothetical protein
MAASTARSGAEKKLFFWEICHPDEPPPVQVTTGELPDYLLIFVDGPKAVRAARTDGGGPGGCHMLPHEGWDTLREYYVPHDGRPHRIEGEYRRSGAGGSVGRKFLICSDLVVERDAPEWPDAERSPAQVRPPAAGLDPAVAIVDRTMSHVEVTDERMASMARETAHRGALAGEMVAAQAQASSSLVLDFMREQQRLEAERQRSANEQLAALQAQVFALGQHAIQSGERVAVARARADAREDAPPTPVAGLGSLGGVIEAGKAVLPFALMAWNKIGGWDGLKEKAGAFLGGAGGGGRGFELLAGALNRGIEAIENVAMAKQAVASPGVHGLPPPTDDGGADDEAA